MKEDTRNQLILCGYNKDVSLILRKSDMKAFDVLFNKWLECFKGLGEKCNAMILEFVIITKNIATTSSVTKFKQIKTNCELALKALKPGLDNPQQLMPVQTQIIPIEYVSKDLAHFTISRSGGKKYLPNFKFVKIKSKNKIQQLTRL